MEDRRIVERFHSLSHSDCDLRLGIWVYVFLRAVSALLIDGARMETTTGPAWEEAIARAL